jgi:hypothetical protein
VLAANSLFPRKQGIILSKQGIHRPDREIPLIGWLIGWAGRLRTFNAPLAPGMSTSGAEPKIGRRDVPCFLLYYRTIPTHVKKHHRSKKSRRKKGLLSSLPQLQKGFAIINLYAG